MFLTADAALAAYYQAIADHKTAVESGDVAARESARVESRYAWGWFQAMADRRKADRSARGYTADRAGFGPVKIDADCEDGHTRPARKGWDRRDRVRNSAEFPAPIPADADFPIYTAAGWIAEHQSEPGDEWVSDLVDGETYATQDEAQWSADDTAENGMAYAVRVRPALLRIDRPACRIPAGWDMVEV